MKTQTAISCRWVLVAMNLMGVYGVFPRSRRAWISAQNAGGRQVRKPRFCSGFAAPRTPSGSSQTVT